MLPCRAYQRCEGEIVGKISVIVPVYNVEAYIGRCLDSLWHKPMLILKLYV